MDLARAAHVVAVIEAIESCAEAGGPVSVKGASFPQPSPPSTSPTNEDGEVIEATVPIETTWAAMEALANEGLDLKKTFPKNLLRREMYAFLLWQ